MIYKLLLFVCISFLAYAQSFQWVKPMPILLSTNPGFLSSVVTVDGNGNPLYARLINNKYSYGSTYYGNSEVAKRNSSGVIIYSDTLFGKTEVTSIKSDNSGNIICTGSFMDTLRFKSYPPLLRSENYPAGFIAKINSEGNAVWIKNTSEFFPPYHTITSLITDDMNNIWITAEYTVNSYIKKLNPNGEIIAAFENLDARTINSISIDNNGNIWASGACFNGNINFNGTTVTAPYSYNEYVVKYSSIGNLIWVRFIEDITFQNWRVVTDNNGNGYLSGNLFDSTSFGTLQAHGPSWVYDFFLTKIDAGGNFIWLREVPQGNLGDASVGVNSFISCSQGNEIYLTGFLRSTVNFGNGVVLSSAGSMDALFLKYSSIGDLIWAKRGGSPSDEIGHSIASDLNGNVYFSGRMNTSAQFDSVNVTGAVGHNFFIGRLSDNPVPVELSSFTAAVSGSEVILQWSTVTENNNKGFEIERTIGIGSSSSLWQKIGFISGGGYSLSVKNYIFKDVHLTERVYSYRLRQIDYDGSEKYYYLTGSVEVTVPGRYSLEQNYPNPFNPATTISFSIPINQEVKIRLFNSIGEEIDLLADGYYQKGNHIISLNAEGLSSGVYFYRIDVGTFSQTRKLTILR